MHVSFFTSALHCRITDTNEHQEVAMSHCRVYLLNESKIEIGVDLRSNGLELLESVCKYLNIVEVDYFGLKYKGNNYDGLWVRNDRPIRKQFPIHSSEWEFVFALKYYPADPTYLREEITKYQLCLQIREDLMSGRLQCPLTTLITLSSYWLQSEFGDGEEQSDEVKQYLTSLKSLSGDQRPDPDFEEKVEKLYKSRRGMPPGDADTQFIRLAASLPLYGVHRYSAENQSGEELMVGVGASGIFELRKKENPVKYRWKDIKNVNYKKKSFFVKLLASKKGAHSEKKSYHLKSYLFAKGLWRESVDQHIFFRATCADTSSAGRTPMSTPRTRGKGNIKRKRTLSFRLSFRKKRPKTEEEVREESSHIRRPDPAVVRHTSLRRSESNKSRQSGSREETISSNNTSFENQKEKIKLQTLQNPILKNPRELSSEESDDQHEGRPFGNEDFEFEETRVKEPILSNSSLLLTVTIPEEDEEVESLDHSPKTPSRVKLSPGEEVSPASTNASPPQITAEVVDSAEDNEKTSPVVVVDVCPDPRKLSIDWNSNQFSNNFLPPPLISQSSRDAIIPYYNKEMQEADEKMRDSTQTTEETAEQQLVNTNAVETHDARVDATKTETHDAPVDTMKIETPDAPVDTMTIETHDVLVDTTKIGTPDALVNTQAVKASSVLLYNDVTKSIDTENPFASLSEYSRNDDEEDRRTVGALSHVAVLGDDEQTIKDLIDDVIDPPRMDYKRQIQEDNGSRISGSSESSISNITDDTEELCNPNILDILWSKCTKEREYGYREIFGVKLRRIKGRQRIVKSNAFDLYEYHTVGTQAPSPPPSDDSDKTSKQPSKDLSHTTSMKKFVPSWPFHPDSLAASVVKLDDVDREAIKTALFAQMEVKKDEDKYSKDFLSNILSTSNDFPLEPVTDSSAQLVEKTPENSSNKIEKTDYIPGIPEFCKSVLKSTETSESGSMRGSHSNLVGLAPTPKLNLANSTSSTTNNQVEALVYPPNIKTLSSTSGGKGILIYQPDSQDNIADNTAICNNPVENIANTDDGSAAVQEFLQESKEETKSIDHVIDALPTHRLVIGSEHGESGRSTPSSVASFPRFVHSVYPLRKMSANWGSVSAESQSAVSCKSESEGTDDVETKSSMTSSSSLSDCSVKSVKGSSNESNSEAIEDPGSFSESFSTQTTLIEFLNESRASHDVTLLITKEDYKCTTTKTTSSSVMSQDDYSDDFTSSASMSSRTVETESASETQSIATEKEVVGSNPQAPAEENPVGSSQLTDPTSPVHEETEPGVAIEAEVTLGVNELTGTSSSHSEQNENSSTNNNFEESSVWRGPAGQSHSVKMYDYEETSSSGLTSDSEHSIEYEFSSSPEGAKQQD